MTPERWQQIRDVLGKALEVAPEQRSALLQRACASDDSLRQEVETLLASSDDVRSSFLQSSPQRVTLTPGTKLGEYEVKSLLGSGGMGEVYRARDSRLGRDVAIKVLPSVLSSDSERLRRFEQEARAAAALSHPNILAVFQMGTYEGAPYLVSELLEGETLREQIKRGRLRVRQAIDHGVQIAHGLSAAHEKGIVHRDLKPENLFVTRDGRVKILDFGLAKLTQPQPGSEHSAITLIEGTEAGVVMGTVGYMAPEQVRGQTADHRADIFAFGAVLYEMLSGKRAFQKPTSADTMSAILNEEPPGISQVTTNISPALQQVVRRCLEKNPEQRFQSASDLAFALGALGESSGTAAAQEVPAAQKRKLWKVAAPAAVLLFAALIAGGLYYRSHQTKRLTEKDTILLADFDNKTGDAVFDDALKQALAIELGQSPFLNILSDRKVSETLRMMNRPENERVTADVGRELCLRTGSKAVLGGTISSLGSHYVIDLNAAACSTGDTLAKEQVEATSKEDVLNGLSRASSSLRTKLGESLPSVQKFDVPIEVTTSSLEALKNYSTGDRVAREKGDAPSIPFYKRAIELDPDFPMAYAVLATAYNNLGQRSLALEYASKAYQLRGQATEREKLNISADYFYVTGELDKEMQTYELWTATYPRSQNTHLNLGADYNLMGQYEKALPEIQEALRLAPDDVIGYENLGATYFYLNRLDEAQATFDQAFAHKLDSGILRQYIYYLAFLRGDTARMQEQVAWGAGKSGDEDWLLADQSDTEAYYGRLNKARDFTRQAVDSAVRADAKETAAYHQGDAAEWEAEVGNTAAAKQAATAALALSPGRDVKVEVAIALARIGDVPRAKALAEELEETYPTNTILKVYCLPTINAAIELNKGNSSHAIVDLEAATPYELTNVGNLYSAYLRGQAYLLAHNGTAAAAEFQRILDHRGIVLNSVTGALAHLQIGRAYAMQGDIPKAKTAYQDFLTLWKDADPDIPILKQAKAEYAKLQ